MKTLSELNLKFQSLGLKEKRRATGGWTDPYTGIVYEDGTMNGGNLSSVTVTAYGNGGSSPYDSAYWSSYINFMRNNGGAGNGGDYGSGGADGYSDYGYNGDYNGSQESQYYEMFLSNFTGKEQHDITKFIESLPPELQQQNLKIAINENKTNPYFLHADQTGTYKDSNGQYVTQLLNQDVLVFNNFDQIKGNLWEEAFHQWQYHHYNFDSDSHINHSELILMEFQTDIVEFLRLRVNGVPLTSLAGETNFVGELHNFFGKLKVDYKMNAAQIATTIVNLTQDDWKTLYDSWKNKTGAYDLYTNDGEYNVNVNAADIENLPWYSAIYMWFKDQPEQQSNPNITYSGDSDGNPYTYA